MKQAPQIDMGALLGIISGVLIGIACMVAFVGLFRDESAIETSLLKKTPDREDALEVAQTRVKLRRRIFLGIGIVGVVVGLAAIGAALAGWHA